MKIILIIEDEYTEIMQELRYSRPLMTRKISTKKIK